MYEHVAREYTMVNVRKGSNMLDGVVTQLVAWGADIIEIASLSLADVVTYRFP